MKSGWGIPGIKESGEQAKSGRIVALMITIMIMMPIMIMITNMRICSQRCSSRIKESRTSGNSNKASTMLPVAMLAKGRQ